LNAEYDDLVTPIGTSAAEESQKMLPHARVIKAFYTTFVADFDSPLIDGNTDAFIAGNHADAINIVSDVVRTAGFNPVPVGDLTLSRTLTDATDLDSAEHPEQL
jgi:predicted dinucleotide-binding enzyme